MRVSHYGSKISWSLAFFLFASVTGFTSSLERDSLEQLLDGSRGEYRLLIMNNLVELYNQEAPEIAEQKARQALQFSEELKSSTGHVKALRNVGNYHYHQNVYDSSIYYHKLALSKVTEEVDILEKAKIMNGLGVTFDVMGEKDSALHYLMIGLEINEAQNDPKGISNTLSNIAYFYFFQDNDEEALSYFQRCLEIDRQIGENRSVAQDLSNIGAIYSNLKEHHKALEVHKQALQIRREINSPPELAKSLNNISLTYDALGDYKKAISMAEEALAIRRTLNDQYDLAISLYNLSFMYRESIQDFSTAKKYQLEALALAESLDLLDLRILVTGSLAKTYAKMGAYKDAYETENKMRLLQNESRAVEKDQRITELMAEFDAMQQRNQLDSLRLRQEVDAEKLERSSQRVFFLRIGMLVCFVLMLIITILFLQKRRRNTYLRILNQALEERNVQIAEKNKEIEEKSSLLSKKNHEILEINANLESIVEERTQVLQATNKELDTFVYQTSHALRAPLMRVMGLFSIIRDTEDEATRSAMQAKIDTTIGGMDRMLYKLLDVQEIKLRALEPARIDLSQTVEEITHEVRGKSELPPPKWKLDIPSQKVMVGDRFILRSILLNLIENAYHFRHEDRIDTHEIAVQIQIANETQLSISISDNGMGIPETEIDKAFDMFYRGTYKSLGTGLGLYVVHKCLAKMGGSIQLESQEDVGSSFELSLPLPQLSL